jgi:Prenyltransferase and squalene oxidase repeat
MRELRIILGLCLLAFLLPACACQPKSTSSTASAKTRAVKFLQREVPAWSRENGCYSCHNNGDAARALFAASQRGYQIPRVALEDTTVWVAAPATWNSNQGDPGFSDKRLADVQFAASLAAAIESGVVKDPNAMKAAAIKVAKAQAEDGSWPIDTANPVGSPATYGTTLATFMAWESLKRSTSPEVSIARQKAEQRLSATKPDSVPNAAVLLLFHGSRRGNEADHSNRRQPPPHGGGYEASLEFLRRTQTSDGGWGPYPDSPPEAFDTALALLALAELRAEPGVPQMIQRGRAFLTATQLPDGSWPATTRPSGGRSYAQQMSTTGWVTLALLATR